MKKTKEDLYNTLRSLRMDLLVASSKADKLSLDMPKELDLTKPFNILGKEISDLMVAVSYMMGDTNNRSLKEWAVRPPVIADMKGIKLIREYFKKNIKKVRKNKHENKI